MAKYGKCQNIDCEFYREVQETEDFICPGCELNLKETKSGGKKMKVPWKLISLVVGVGLLLFGMFSLFSQNDETAIPCDEYICCEVGGEYESIPKCKCKEKNSEFYELNKNNFDSTPCKDDGGFDIPPPDEDEEENNKIPEFDRELAQAETEASVNNFYEFLENIVKAENKERREEVREQALRLCIGEGMTVEVSNNSTGREVFTITEYLDRVENYKYSAIEIDVDNIKFSKDFEKVTNSEFPEMTANIEYDQAFKGYSLGRLMFGDNTKKSAEIIAKIEEDSQTGNKVWKVYLSHISVEEDATPL